MQTLLTLVLTPLLLLIGYSDFFLSKPSQWRSEQWAYWIFTTFGALVWRNLTANDPGAVSGTGYLFLLVIVPVWSIVTLRRGGKALLNLLGGRGS